jgi:hypothetical protein
VFHFANLRLLLDDVHLESFDQRWISFGIESVLSWCCYLETKMMSGINHSFPTIQPQFADVIKPNKLTRVNQSNFRFSVVKCETSPKALFLLKYIGVLIGYVLIDDAPVMVFSALFPVANIWIFA